MSVVARAAPSVIEDDVLLGLRHAPKRLPPRILYDGSAERALQIEGLDDYYPSRCELRLLDAHLPTIAHDVGIISRVLEPEGVDGGIRTKRLRAAFETFPCGRTLVFASRCYIDRCEPHDAVNVLADLQRRAGRNACLLLAADGSTDRTAIEHAYNDPDGYVAAFNMRTLARVNGTRDGTFDLRQFRHRALWNARASRVELQLVSQCAQDVVVSGEHFAFAAHEPLVTQHVYKHSLHAMRGLLGAAGWMPTHVFTAYEQPVRLWLCAPTSSP